MVNLSITVRNNVPNIEEKYEVVKLINILRQNTDK